MISTLETPLAPMLYTDNNLIFELSEDGNADDLFEKFAHNSTTKK